MNGYIHNGLDLFLSFYLYIPSISILYDAFLILISSVECDYIDALIVIDYRDESGQLDKLLLNLIKFSNRFDVNKITSSRHHEKHAHSVFLHFFFPSISSSLSFRTEILGYIKIVKCLRRWHEPGLIFLICFDSMLTRSSYRMNSCCEEYLFHNEWMHLCTNLRHITTLYVFHQANKKRFWTCWLNLIHFWIWCMALKCCHNSKS